MMYISTIGILDIFVLIDLNFYLYSDKTRLCFRVPTY